MAKFLVKVPKAKLSAPSNIPGVDTPDPIQILQTAIVLGAERDVSPPSDGLLSVSDLAEDVTSMLQTPFQTDAGVSTTGTTRLSINWPERSRGFQLDNGQTSQSETDWHSSEFVISDFMKRLELKRTSLLHPQSMSSAEAFGVNTPVDILITMRRLILQLWFNGESELAYDGQSFFDDSHPGVGLDLQPVTMSNLFTGNLAINATNLTTVITAMSTYTDSRGNLFTPGFFRFSQSTQDQIVRPRPAPIHIFAGMANLGALHALTNITQQNPGEFAGGVSYSIVPEITARTGNAKNSWYVYRVGDVSPFKMAQGELRSDTVEDANHDKYIWINRIKLGVGTGEWRSLAAVPWV